MRTRQLHRAKRRKVPHPIVALVGYTNAGKSTLFNRITGAGVLAEDMLFATLDPTLRRMKLPHGRTVILSDTVGFISDLPTHLVAAFRATLEEVLEADLILHVRDMSDPDNAAQSADVLRILGDLGIDEKEAEHRIIEVWNKVDRLDPEAHDAIMQRAEGSANIRAVSAITGEGVDALMDEISKRLSGVLTETTVVLSVEQLPLISWVYSNSIVDGREDHEDGSVALDVRLSKRRPQSWNASSGRRPHASGRTGNAERSRPPLIPSHYSAQSRELTFAETSYAADQTASSYPSGSVKWNRRPPGKAKIATVISPPAAATCRWASSISAA